MTSEIRQLAPAKVNLTLHVTGQREDGYHLLDSLVAFADFGDDVYVSDGPTHLSVEGDLAAGVPTGPTNLMWRALDVMGAEASLRLVKRLPAEAGIGGGSSDAAAVLRAIGGSTVEQQISLGADVPVCMLATAARMRGVGERVEKVALPPLPALLINPRVSMPTPAVFSAMTKRTNAEMPMIPTFEGVADAADWLATMRNDMQDAAISIQPVIERALSDLQSTRQCLLARMSGSGATCFAIYPTMKAAHFAAYELGAMHTDWWIRPCTLS